MSLATRCTSCSTVFRVVQDQLRVSSGWVRCGRCGEVFNAIESLVDLDVERPDSPVSVHGSRVMEDLARFSGVVDEERTATSAAPRELPTPGETMTSAPATEVGAERVELSAPIDPDRRSEPLPVDTSSVPAPLASGAKETEAAAPSDGAVPAPEADDASGTPRFVRQADRAARWRHPWVRAALSTGVVLAFGGLIWQMLWSHHDWIATRWPIAKPVVAVFCAWSGCRVEPPRLLDALAVDSSGLVRATGASGYRLAVTVRNRSELRVRAPALDLTLTDTAGTVIARRVVGLAELGEASDSVGPGGELSASALLRVDGATVSGYTVEIFYP